MQNTEALCGLFRRNMPFAVRSDGAVMRLLGDERNTVLERKTAAGELVAAVVLRNNTIYLLCVDEAWRGQGIGSALLCEAEERVRKQGYSQIVVGAGEGYLTPGVPTSRRVYDEPLGEECMNKGLTDAAQRFFERRGYMHQWGECNCFDMRMYAKDAVRASWTIGETIEGVQYRWAEASDMEAVCACTDDAHEHFTQYYRREEIYAADSAVRVLIAQADGQICGALLVCRETEGAGRGSVGCTAVRQSYRGRGIAGRLVLLGTQALWDAGMQECFLGYTYSGLDRLYGRAGYRICAYHFMACKSLTPGKKV